MVVVGDDSAYLDLFVVGDCLAPDCHCCLCCMSDVGDGSASLDLTHPSLRLVNMLKLPLASVFFLGVVACDFMVFFHCVCTSSWCWVW